MQSLAINEAALRDIIASREALIGSLDAKRPRAWEQYGYRQTLAFEDYLQAYERGGAAHGAVHRLLEKSWSCAPRIKAPEGDEETPFELAISKVLKGIQAWKKLQDFDRRNMIGRYAGLIYRVADGKRLSEPLQTAARLVDIVPLYENQLRVQAWDSNPDSETFGAVTMWQYRFRPPQAVDKQAAPDRWVDVHPSRVQILAEGSAGDFLDGVPLLKAGFNHLVDLEKIGGGSAESYLKNSARTVVLQFDANAAPQNLTQNADGTPGTKTVAQAIEEKTRALNTNIDSSIVTQGGQVSTLQTTVHDPEPAFNVAANLFAASVRIPMTILFGAQTGRLASDQDSADMNARCKARQENELEPMIREFITRMQAAGVLEAGEFEVEFEDLDSPSDAQKVEILKGMTGAMEQAFRAGLAEPLFDANELRGVLDYEERADDGLPDPSLTPLDDPQLGDPPPPVS
jgi:uncharacterized protein